MKVFNSVQFKADLLFPLPDASCSADGLMNDSAVWSVSGSCDRIAKKKKKQRKNTTKHISEGGQISKLNIPEPQNRNLSPKAQDHKEVCVYMKYSFQPQKPHTNPTVFYSLLATANGTEWGW